MRVLLPLPHRFPLFNESVAKHNTQAPVLVLGQAKPDSGCECREWSLTNLEIELEVNLMLTFPGIYLTLEPMTYFNF